MVKLNFDQFLFNSQVNHLSNINRAYKPKLTNLENIAQGRQQFRRNSLVYHFLLVYTTKFVTSLASTSSCFEFKLTIVRVLTLKLEANDIMPIRRYGRYQKVIHFSGTLKWYKNFLLSSKSTICLIKGL